MMQEHVLNYFKAFGYDQSSFIPCEWCNSASVEIHHIEPRSKFGSKRKDEQDAPDNLIALCRMCHDKAHGAYSKDIKVILKELIKERVKELKKTKI
jgi:5-methylcytosine-specific restriction endonuclease McrA